MFANLRNIYKKNQLKTQFIFVAFLLAVIPVMTYLLMSYGSYYKNVRKIFEDSVESRYDKSMEQLNNIFEHLSNTGIVAFYSKNQQQVLCSKSKQDFYGDFQTARANFDTFISINPTVSAIKFEGVNGYTYLSSNEIIYNGDMVYDSEIFDKGNAVFINNTSDDYFVIVKKIKSIYDNYFSDIGTGYIFVNKNELIKTVHSKSPEEIMFVIKDAGGNVVVSTITEPSYTAGGRNLYRSEDITGTDFTFEVYASDSELTRFKSVWVNTSIFILALIGVMVLLIFVMMNHFMFRPMNSLAKAFAAYGETGRVESIQKYNITNEVTDIIEKFNDMAVKNKELNYRILHTQANLYETELNKRQLELNSLQVQIKSHFLYNVLSNIRGMMLKNHTENAIEMLSSLYRFLRYITNSREFVRIEEEIVYAENYIKLQNTRMNREIKLRIKIDEDVRNAKTLKLILQPIIENAVIHGFSENTLIKSIYITAKKDGENVMLRVMDSGLGMSAEKLNSLFERIKANTAEDDSIALVNIYRRLMLHYNGKAEIKIKSRRNIGTAVILSVPFEEVENYEYSSSDR